MSLWKKPDAKSLTQTSQNEVPAQRALAEPVPSKPATRLLSDVDKAPDEQFRKVAASANNLAARFGDAINLLMRNSRYKHYTLADLEWLVVPALNAGQFSVANAQSNANGAIAPVGVVLWAHVSDDVDRRLSASNEQDAALTPAEWKSGENLWAFVTAGDPRVVNGILSQLLENQWSGRKVKLFARNQEGRSVIATLEKKAA